MEAGYLARSLDEELKAPDLELNQLVNLYGQDARIFLISCLVSVVLPQFSIATPPRLRRGLGEGLVARKAPEGTDRAIYWEGKSSPVLHASP